jgi:hypothetical protein
VPAKGSPNPLSSIAVLPCHGHLSLAFKNGCCTVGCMEVGAGWAFT